VRWDDGVDGWARRYITLQWLELQRMTDRSWTALNMGRWSVYAWRGVGNDDRHVNVLQDVTDMIHMLSRPSAGPSLRADDREHPHPGEPCPLEQCAWRNRRSSSSEKHKLSTVASFVSASRDECFSIGIREVAGAYIHACIVYTAA